MLYDYKCDDCHHEIKDQYQSIHDEALKRCPSCGKDTLCRVIYGGLGCFVKDVKTIGQLADKNWSNMGSYQKSEIESKKENKSTKKSAFSNFGKASSKDINKMTAAQKERYIITGEK